MSTMTEDQIQSVLDTIRDHLKTRSATSDVPLKVEKGAYRQDDEWLVVVVSPARKGIRAYDYVEALGEVEKELRAEGIEHVILVPAMAD